MSKGKLVGREQTRTNWPATMKNLFDPTLADDVKQRILRLHPESERLWGNMPVTMALAHCTAGFHMATGTLRPKRAPFPAYVLGRLIKPVVFGDDKPIRRNSPSSPELFLADPAQSDFEVERTRLLQAIDRFVANGAAGCTTCPHPFFGPLQPQQWAILMYKHLDHHLRQFGA